MVALAAGDLLLEAGMVGIGVTEKCSMPLVAIAGSLARYLSGLQMVNLFTAAIVLKKWGEEAIDLQTIDQDMMTDLTRLNCKVAQT